MLLKRGNFQNNYLFMMKKLLGIIVLSLLWCNISDAQIFNFEKVYMCGPKKIPYDEQLKSRGWYYTVHLDKDERFIIRNNEYNYSSFEKTYYHTLWVQNGKITSAELSKDSTTYYFELTSVYLPGATDSYKRIKYLDINFDSMTYVQKIKDINADGTSKMFDPTIGVCWKEW